MVRSTTPLPSGMRSDVMPEVPPAEHGFTLFGPDAGVPEGGFCSSAFVVVRRSDRVLVGRMSPEHADTWTQSWAPNLELYEGERRKRLFDGLRFPATYLRAGEHPRAAARRVWRDQLGLEPTGEEPPPTVVAGAKPSRSAPNAEHLDLLFLFEVEGPELVDVPEHWAELGYRDVERLHKDDFVMLHGDLLNQL